MNLSATILQMAYEHGFDLVGITSTEDFLAAQEHAIDQVNKGHMDGLNWYTKARILRGSSPSVLMPEVKSIISLGLNYYQSRNANDWSDAHIAKYAQGRDYHKTLKTMMRNYINALEKEVDYGISAKWYVDDGPMLDKAIAQRSGLGWFGKNSNILSKRYGSWILLGEILTDLSLESNEPLLTNCGDCTICIDMCPTEAIVEPYQVNTSLCISFHTIENRGSVPINLRKSFGQWVFGCDICQDVCPVNKFQADTRSNQFDTNRTSTSILELLEMSEQAFKAKFAGTPVMRAKYSGMQRNACIAAGNHLDNANLPGLLKCLEAIDPIVRSHAAWALGQFDTTATRQALKIRRKSEEDAGVITEIDIALGTSTNQ
tara:strand:+ start:24774 stop:25892 length:1119 start_codon:yes stop_codon:yes gene_type:complete